MARDPDRGRDRDERGRARNARPRDRLGRPLSREQAGVAPWPEDTTLTAGDFLAAAQSRLDRGWPFQAHEVLEAAWKSAPEPERALWQGLAQLAVGVTHAARGNLRGAAALLRRGRDAIEPYRDTAPHDIDVSGLLSWATSCLALLSQAGNGPVVSAHPGYASIEPRHGERSRHGARRDHGQLAPRAASHAVSTGELEARRLTLVRWLSRTRLRSSPASSSAG